MFADTGGEGWACIVLPVDRSRRSLLKIEATGQWKGKRARETAYKTKRLNSNWRLRLAASGTWLAEGVLVLADLVCFVCFDLLFSPFLLIPSGHRRGSGGIMYTKWREEALLCSM